MNKRSPKKWTPSVMTAKWNQSSQKNQKNTFESIMAKVKLKETHKVNLAEIVLDVILQSDIVNIGEESTFIYINNESTDIQVSPFLYDLQQPTKKIDQEAYSKILLVLPLMPDVCLKHICKANTRSL